MSSLPVQAIGILAFLSLIIIFQNSMANDLVENNFLDNASLINSGASIGYMNESTMADEGESIMTTLKNIGSFNVNTSNNYLSAFFYILIIWEAIVLYLLLHPFK